MTPQGKARVRDRIGRQGGRRTVHGDGIARGDGRAGARLDDFHGGGDTGDGLHGREDGGYDEKEERGERPAHPIVCAPDSVTTAFCRRASETHARKLVGARRRARARVASTLGSRIFSRRARRLSHLHKVPSIRLGAACAVSFARRRSNRAESVRRDAFVRHCPCCPPKNPSAHRTSCMSASSPSHVFLAASLTRSARILRLSLD